MKRSETGNVPAWRTAKGKEIIVENLLGILLTIAAVFLHAVFFLNAGAFWRDEANSIAIGLKPTAIEIWSSLKADSHPVLHVLLVRIWSGLFGSGDLALRSLGFVIGTGIISMLWFKARKTDSGPPLLSLLLVGMSPVMIRALESARAYGVAALSIILSFTLIWRTLRRPTAARIIISTLPLILGVHSLYQSASLVLAVGISAISVGFIRGGLKHAAFIAVPFCVAALSLLPYAGPLREARDWWPLATNPLASALLPAFLEAVGSPIQMYMFVWPAVAILAIMGMFRSFEMTRTGADDQIKTRGHFLLYCGITAAATVACTMFFLYLAGPISFQPWYYVLPLTTFAVSAEPLAQHAIRKAYAKVPALSAISIIAILSLLPAGRGLTMRMTSVDLAAFAVGARATPLDLVIVNPWYVGVSFNRYYRGSAPWMTFPALDDNAIHRYDLLKKRMLHPERSDADIDRISSTLKKGGRVWLISNFEMMRPEAVQSLPPPPLPVTGWSSAPYVTNWSEILMNTLLTHASQAEEATPPSMQNISPLETPQVAVFSGWKP